jgi:MFS family permease
MVQWLVCIIAAIGFAFDTYVLLMNPLILRPALSELLHVSGATKAGNDLILRWTGYVMWGSALCGGVFGMLGGYLTDWLGRRRVLTWSILLYAVASAAGAFVNSAEMLLFWRCMAFIGVCVEFVAAVAWLSELFPDPHRREAVLGYTQAFASVGGLFVSLVYKASDSIAHADSLPAWLTLPNHAQGWRYALISGLIPAIPLIIIRPFLPESPEWRAKKQAGKLGRPRFTEVFQPAFRRTTIVSAILFACAFGAAFGAIQLTPQMVPGLIAGRIASTNKQLAKADKGSEQFKELTAKVADLKSHPQQIIGTVQLIQEVGGLAGRIVLAWLAVRIVSRRKLLRLFIIPGLLIIPLVYAIPAAGHLGYASLDVLKVGMFLTGFFTVAQFSFFGNYLPRMYPTRIRGTGESFAANVGGRMIGTGANFVTTQLAVALPLMMHNSDFPRPAALAYSAAAVVLAVYLIGFITSFWLPEPRSEALPE